MQGVSDPTVDSFALPFGNERQLRSGSVQPSSAVLIRTAFKSFESPAAKVIRPSIRLHLRYAQINVSPGPYPASNSSPDCCI